MHDAQAIASGKRRSNPQAYRAAQAAVHTTTRTTTEKGTAST
ncbi:hypothetical protein [Streptomyces tricolor]|nr:hypothetical protein [Streptomyces tricolor]